MTARWRPDLTYLEQMSYPPLVSGCHCKFLHLLVGFASVHVLLACLLGEAKDQKWQSWQSCLHKLLWGGSVGVEMSKSDEPYKYFLSHAPLQALLPATECWHNGDAFILTPRSLHDKSLCCHVSYQSSLCV